MLSLVVHSQSVKSQDDLLSNTEILHEVIRKSVEQLESEIPDNAHINLAVQYPEYDWFFHHRASEVLRELGYTVSVNNVSDRDVKYSVEVGIEQIGIRYNDIRRRSIFGSRVITRSAGGVFSFRITGENTEKIVRVTENITDEVPYSKHPEIENSALPFTQAVLPGGSLTDRYLGPAVIVAATGVVVYLFFSVRS